MTIEVSKTNAAMITKMHENGKTFTQISSAMMALDMVENMEQAVEYLASVGIEKGRKIGVMDNMFSFLKEQTRTQEEFFSWIDEHGSESMKKTRKTHDKVRELANAIHEKYSVSDAA